ncbi:MAG: hypothetical protein CMF22_10625 [Idiomarinaceae bacterium]|nr:hypothetical protein [Idiomarinaceae bacterium]MBG23895.1 hypothetical protein [Idiomarinaceae bacterium]|tara:strand:+ start:6946 stop:7677 length:732 start_codon:yes stop_codon:yes gene_type:complete
MNLDNINYVEQAKERVTEQFKDKPHIEQLLTVWLEGNQELEDTFINIEKIKDIDESSGVQLDNIGNIIGQPRELVDIAATGFFGFSDDPGAKPFGSVDNGQGGLYYSLFDPESGVIGLSDGLFKTFLKAKIVQNNAGTNPEEIIRAVQSIFEPVRVEFFEGGTDENEPAVFTLSLGRDWNDPDQTVFPGLDETQVADRLLPKPAGVRIEYINEQVTPTFEAVETWVVASNNLYATANTIFLNL